MKNEAWKNTLKHLEEKTSKQFRASAEPIRLREMRERHKIKSDAGESKEKDDTASGTSTLSWRKGPPKGYTHQNKRQV